MPPEQMIELYPNNKFLLRGEDYTVCTRWGACVVKLQPSFGGQYWILGDVFIEVCTLGKAPFWLTTEAQQAVYLFVRVWLILCSAIGIVMYPPFWFTLRLYYSRHFCTLSCTLSCDVS